MEATTAERVPAAQPVRANEREPLSRRLVRQRAP